jgi:acetyl-CoA carboxylase carboxyl transferase subunit beta
MGIFDSIRSFLGPTPEEGRKGGRSGKKKQGEGAYVGNERFFVEKKHSCPSCQLHIEIDDLKRNLFVCPGCGHHFPVTAAERIGMIADENSFKEMDSLLESEDPLQFPGYGEKLANARQKARINEAVITGTCSIESREVALGVMSFAFMGGSMGAVVGEKITRLMAQASQKKVPVILFTSSGGARMQEGIVSLMQMAKTSHAAAMLEESGQPLILVLTHPTTGGVTASFAMLGNIILAEPGALIGFAGPRVIESTLRQKLPEGFQRAEFQEQKGFVDRVCHRSEMKRVLTLLIDAHRPWAVYRQGM